MPKKQKLYLGILILFLILIGNSLFLNFNAFRCFNFFDMGGFLDASWRVFCGQKPYKDFIYSSGPIHLYLNALFFKIFGFGKTAILAHLVTIHSLVIIFVFLMLYKRVPLYITIVGTLLTAPSFYWSLSHPWHDQTAHFFGLLGLTLLVTQTPFTRKIFKYYVLSSCCALLAIASKANVGLAYWVVFFCVAGLSPQRKKACAGFLTGTLIGSLIALGFIRYPVEYWDQLTTFSQTSESHKRLANFLFPSGWFVNYYWIAFLLMLINSWFTKKICRELFALFSGITLIGIFTVHTGGMIKPPNNFLWGVQVSMAYILLFQYKNHYRRWGKNIFITTLIILIGLTLFLTIRSVQYGLQLKVWTYAADNPQGDFALTVKPLEGWLCHKLEGQPLEKLVDFVNAYVGKNDSLLNLSNLYIIYAITGRDSYRHIPFLFQWDIFPAPGKQTSEVRAHILQNPPKWIVIHMSSYFNEIIFLGIKNFINTQYKIVARAGLYYVLKKK